MSYRIAVLPGDGTGKEVIHEAQKVLSSLALDIEMIPVKCGSQYYAETGKAWEEGGFETCKYADAILFGAAGWPGIKYASGETPASDVIFSMRFGLDLYANVRPTKLFPNVKHKISGAFERVWKPENVDFVIVRENTEGLYTRAKGTLERGGEKELAIDTRVITRKGCERVIEYAICLAEKRKKKLACADKSNVTQGCKLFRQIFSELSNKHKIETECIYIDAFALSLMREPEKYDVVVTTNMFGDIMTDLAAVLQGGLGMAPSGNIGDKHAMFEPVHGTSPDIAGKDVVNPIAAILSAGMMLDYLGEKHSDAKMKRASQAIERAVADTLACGMATFDLGGNARTHEVGDAIAKKCEMMIEH